MILTRKENSILNGFSKEKFYRPLEVIFNQGSKVFKLFGDDDEVPGLYDGSHFNIVDARFYSDWVMAVESEGVARLTSKEFLEPGFWDDFLNKNPAAVQAYNLIMNPLPAVSLSTDFVERVKNVPWAAVDFLVQNRWLKPELATYLSIPRLEIPEGGRIQEILTFLSPSGEGKREAALLLAAWGYENRSNLRDPILYLEDVYLKCFPAAELKAAMPFLNPKIPNEDILVNWKCVLDAYVYNKVLAE